MRWVLNRITSLGLGTRIIAITLLVVVTVVVVNNLVFISKHREAANAAMVDKAAAFTAVADEAKNHTAKLQADGDFDNTTLLAELKEARQAAEASGQQYDYQSARIFKTIPVVAGWLAAQEAAEREGLDFRITTFDARNPDNEPESTFTESMLRDLTGQVDGGGDTFLARVEESTNTLHYMRAITLSQDCMLCHGQPSTSQTGDGKDVLGFRMEGWEVGDMHGAYHVKMPLSAVDHEVQTATSSVLMFVVPLVIAAVIAFIFALRFMFVRPIGSLIERVNDIAGGEGDLTQRINVKSNDEIGRLGKGFNAFIEKIHDVVFDVRAATEEVASAATEIASSSEQIAAGMEQQSSQVNSISAAVEEMSASVTEVAGKSADASSKSEQAKSLAETGSDVVESTISDMNEISGVVSESSVAVEGLGKQSEQIGEVTNVINEIADQTNLLALNAAIEAARAGEHGRGFAVVADEVRKLADRTTQATSEIAGSIESIRNATAQAVELMTSGSSKVQKGVSRAAEAGSSLKEIYGSVTEVVSVIGGIAAAAEQQSVTATEVSRNIEQVASVIRETKDGTTQAANAAMSLSQQAENLRRLIGQFKCRKSESKS